MAKGVEIKTGDYKICITSACYFLKVAEECFGKNGIDFLAGYMYPYAVNVAFSCELFIKVIMIHNSNDNEFIKGHDLKDLFNYLPPANQKAIRILYEEKCTDNLIRLLEEDGETFENWRYALEKGTKVNATAMMSFAQTLKEYVLKLAQ